MTESASAGGSTTPGRCPWCSAEVPDLAAATCLTCGAALHEQVEGDLPGVTQIDAAGLVTQRRLRGGGVRALIGLSDEETQGSPARALPQPPSEEVKREMLRLRIDVLAAEIEARAAELAAARAEAVSDGVLPAADPAPGAEPALAGEPAPPPPLAEQEADEPA